MKRITVWIDCEDTVLEEIIRRIKESVESLGSWLSIICVDELVWPVEQES